MSNPTLAEPASPALPPRNIEAPATGRLFGIAMAITAVTLWAGGLVLTRYGLKGSLTIADIILLRVLLPALMLLPFLPRHLPAIRGVSWPLLLVMLAGSGLPFMALSSTGAYFAPVAHAGALMPGCMPLFAALLAFLLLHERVDRMRGIGFVLMAIGALSLGGWTILHGEDLHGSGKIWLGDLSFLTGGFFWACYTVALRKSGLQPVAVTALVYIVSILLFLPVYFSGLLPVNIWNAPAWEIGVQLAQSVLSGLASMFAFSIAIRRLGAASGAAFATLVPVMAALMGIPILGEFPDAVSWSAIVLITIGVALTSGMLGVILRRLRRPAAP